MPDLPSSGAVDAVYRVYHYLHAKKFCEPAGALQDRSTMKGVRFGYLPTFRVISSDLTVRFAFKGDP